jgi:hypothetical protein
MSDDNVEQFPKRKAAKQQRRERVIRDAYDVHLKETCADFSSVAARAILLGWNRDLFVEAAGNAWDYWMRLKESEN